MSIVKFLSGKSHQWINYNINNYIIWIAADNSKLIAENIAKELVNLKIINKNNISKLLNKIDDHFGLIVIYKDWSFAAVDACRSNPIYWHHSKNGYLLSSQAKTIANFIKPALDINQRLAFQMSGYTIGNGTLWSSIKNINCGEFIFFYNKKDFYKSKYFSYHPWIKKETSYPNLKKMLKLEIKKILENLVKKANGRTIIIPLSAGLDSRLIVSGLKKIGYKNVKCFSYGLKNNFESKASKKIAEKLGFQWKFIEINYTKMRKYFQSNEYKKFFENSNDGCATPGIQDVYAIKKLIDEEFISHKDFIVNGNSGDFISGGHLPISSKEWPLQNNKNNIIDIIFNEHYKKHYSLWESLLTKNNKNIIKEEIKKHVLSIKVEVNKKILPQGIIELIEYENRQAKYVINFQRIYDYYKLNWALPLWDKSFINFWYKVSPEYKINQKLYKEVLTELNMGNVWTNNYVFRITITPLWARIVRFICKIFFIFIGKSKWHKFDKKFISYWIDNLGGQCILPYFRIIKNNKGARHFVSWHTLNAEQASLNSNWQNIDINK